MATCPSLHPSLSMASLKTLLHQAVRTPAQSFAWETTWNTCENDVLALALQDPQGWGHWARHHVGLLLPWCHNPAWITWLAKAMPSRHVVAYANEDNRMVCEGLVDVLCDVVRHNNVPIWSSLLRAPFLAREAHWLTHDAQVSALFKVAIEKNALECMVYWVADPAYLPGLLANVSGVGPSMVQLVISNTASLARWDDLDALLTSLDSMTYVHPSTTPSIDARDWLPYVQDNFLPHLNRPTWERALTPKNLADALLAKSHGDWAAWQQSRASWPSWEHVWTNLLSGPDRLAIITTLCDDPKVPTPTLDMLLSWTSQAELRSWRLDDGSWPTTWQKRQLSCLLRADLLEHITPHDHATDPVRKM